MPERPAPHPGTAGPGVMLPQWPAPARVRACTTTRSGGSSAPPFDSANFALDTGDDDAAVRNNRARLQEALRLPEPPRWLRQVHGTRVVDAARAAPGSEADACVSTTPGRVCALLTADCVPVLLCDRAGTCVGAAHAGWRGLAAGVLENAVRAMHAPPGALLAWLGPGIGPAAFEVGEEVRAAFLAADPGAGEAFAPSAGGRWLADLYRLARRRLAAAGVYEVHGGEHCTYSDPARFFSYRRDGVTGRMATLIWLAGAGAPPPPGSRRAG